MHAVLLSLLITLHTPLTAPTSPPPTPGDRNPPVKAFLSGAVMESLCSTPESAPGGPLDTCLGYLAGVADDMLLKDAIGPSPSLCPPRDFTVGALRDGVLEYLRARPEERALPASFAVDVVVTTAFACSNLVKHEPRG